jgi:hypothetical protein
MSTRIGTKKGTITIFPTLLLLIISFAGTITASMPQIVGLTNAQSEQGSAHACPAGFTLQRGECTQPAAMICPYIFGPSIPGTRAQAGVCDYVGTTSTLTASMCQALGPERTVFVQFIGGNTSCEVLIGLVAGCPNGGQLVNNECETRPGQGNQP